MRKLLDEFKSFAVKGNVVEIAIGLVLAVAFGAVVKSLVDDVLITFALVAFALFVFAVKPYNALRARQEGEEEAMPTAPPEDIALLREIRDALQARR